jgi:hypothetical protein
MLRAEVNQPNVEKIAAMKLPLDASEPQGLEPKFLGALMARLKSCLPKNISE